MGATGLRALCSKFHNAVLSKPYTKEPTSQSPAKEGRFEFDIMDLTSKGAIWDLYNRWIKHHGLSGLSRTEREKREKFQMFKQFAFMVYENNKGYEKGLYLHKLCLNFLADGSSMPGYKPIITILWDEKLRKK